MPSRFFRSMNVHVYMCILAVTHSNQFYQVYIFRHSTKGLICSKSKIFELSDHDMHFFASLDLEYCTPTLRPLKGNIAKLTLSYISLTHLGFPVIGLCRSLIQHL